MMGRPGAGFQVQGEAFLLEFFGLFGVVVVEAGFTQANDFGRPAPFDELFDAGGAGFNIAGVDAD